MSYWNKKQLSFLYALYFDQDLSFLKFKKWLKIRIGEGGGDSFRDSMPILMEIVQPYW